MRAGAHHGDPRGRPPLRHRRRAAPRARLGLSDYASHRAVLPEAAQRGRGPRPRSPPALGVLRQVGAAVRGGRGRRGPHPRVGRRARRPRHRERRADPDRRAVDGLDLHQVGHDQLRDHHRSPHLPARRAVEARHRDPARAREHRVLLAVDLRADGRLGRSRHRVGRGAGSAGLLATCASPRPCRTRSTSRWRRTRTASSTASARPRAADSIPEQIAQLDDLRQRGAISQAEFDQKKQELLDRM